MSVSVYVSNIVEEHLAPGMSVSVYVSNIVEEHLKRHGELLKNELECFLYKDSLWKN